MEWDPDVTEDGLKVTETGYGAGITVIWATAVLLFTEAVMLAGVLTLMYVVPIVNVVLVWPPGTVIVAGTVAAESLEVTLTNNPPIGAAAFMVSLAEAVVPAVTEVGVTVRLRGTGARMVKFAETVVLPEVAVIAASVSVATAFVPTRNDAVVWPPRTVTDAGVDAAGLLDASDTFRPDAGAAALSVRVAVEFPPPVTLEGETDRLYGTGARMESAAEAD